MKTPQTYLITLAICLCQIISIAQSSTAKNKDLRAIAEMMQLGIQDAIDGKMKDGILKFDKAYALAVQKNQNDLLPIIVIAQGRLYTLENNYETCLSKLNNVEQYVLKDSVSALSGDYYELKGQCYLMLGKYEESLGALRKTEAIRKIVEPTKNWRTYNGMARAYNKLNQHQLADEYRSKSESLSKIQNSRRILLDLQNELQFNEQEGTISYLNKERNLVINKLNKSNFKIYLLFLGLGILSIVIGMLYVILRQRNRLNNEMKLRNDIVVKNLEEKEYLVKEIHHRVKNNLQFISSLLSLQSRTLDDKSAIDALTESQSRVLSMSLIHQNLYKDNNHSHLFIDDYIANLVANLMSSYKINKDRITVDLELEHIEMDVNSLVPIGLITNELITNSFKYAFKDSSNQGLIKINAHRFENVLCLNISDDGVGKSPIQDTSGFGQRLIATFAKKLDATINYDYSNGTSVMIKMPINNII